MPILDFLQVHYRLASGLQVFTDTVPSSIEAAGKQSNRQEFKAALYMPSWLISP